MLYNSLPRIKLYLQQKIIKNNLEYLYYSIAQHINNNTSSEYGERNAVVYHRG